MNIKTTNDLYFAICNFQTTNFEKTYEAVGKYPFLLNAFRLSGDKNMSVLLTSLKLKELDKIVNFHFRNKPEISDVSMDLITDVMRNFVLLLDLNFDNCKCSLKLECSNHP